MTSPMTTAEALIAAIAQAGRLTARQLHELSGYTDIETTYALLGKLDRAGQIYRCRVPVADGERAQVVAFVDEVACRTFEAERKAAQRLRDRELERARWEVRHGRKRARRAELKAQREAAALAEKQRKAAELERIRAAREARLQREAMEKEARKAERKAWREQQQKAVKVRMPRGARHSGRRSYDNTVAEMLFRQRRAEHEAADRRQQPVVDPDFSRAKRTVAPAMPDRWAVELPPQGGAFSSLKPGQYAFEPASCAARAAA